MASGGCRAACRCAAPAAGAEDAAGSGRLRARCRDARAGHEVVEWSCAAFGKRRRANVCEADLMGGEAGMGQVVFWHRDLPPIEAEPLGEHVVEAASGRVAGRLDRHGDPGGRCFRELMAAAADRLGQEVMRLGGTCAHVLDEAIDSRHDDRTGEAWLAGRFTYMLYRRP